MGKKVGIPGGLFYYKFKNYWEAFFTELGAEIVISDPTNKRILDDGVKASVDEACVPVKVFFGHVINLKDRVDYIFIPRFTSISRMEYICPEIGGLPDVVRHRVKGLPVLIDVEVNLRNSERNAIKAAVEIGKALDASKRASVNAYKKAVAVCCSGRKYPGYAENLNCPDNFDPTDCYHVCGIGNRPRETCFHKRDRQKVAVIGHPYTIYDRYISMDLLGKLKKHGIDAITIDMVNIGDINRCAARLAKPMFWHYGRTAYGAAVYLAETGSVDGVICITSFGCGVDSFVIDLIERKIRKEYKLPMVVITIDEHTGEAGFNTRLEAFVDMLKWRRSHENYVSSSG